MFITIEYRENNYKKVFNTYSRIIFTSNASITGNSVVCGNTGYFNLISPPENSNISWQISQNNNVVATGTGCNAVYNNFLNGFSGSILYIVSFTCGVQPFTVKHDFWVGKPRPKITSLNEVGFNKSVVLRSNFAGDWSFVGNDYSQYAFSYYPGVNTTQWEIETLNKEGVIRVEVECTNVCGTSSIVKPIEIISTGGGGVPRKTEPAIELSPNPAKDYITIKLTDLNTTDYQTLRIYNNQYYLVEELKINELEQQINISNYAKGLYFIILQGNNKTLSSKFFKE